MAESKVIEQLRAVRAKLEQGWCQGSGAVNRHGQSVDPDDSSACEWCIMGALSTVTDGDIFGAARDYIDAAIGPWFIIEWNDERGRTQAEAVALIDKAIALAEQDATNA